MRYTYALSALRYKRARLAGEIEVIERTLAKRREELTTLDATLRLFHPEADPSHITAVKPIWRGVGGIGNGGSTAGGFVGRRSDQGVAL